jgi:hypothetical protein
VKEREEDRDRPRAIPPRAQPESESEPWHAAAGNVAVQAAIRSTRLPATTAAPLDRLLARAPTRRLARQEADEEEEQGAPPAAQSEGPEAAPAAEAPAAGALEEEELPE